MASNKNASKKAMAKKAARKKALAKKAALGLDQGTSAFSRDESHSIFTQMNARPVHWCEMGNYIKSMR